VYDSVVTWFWLQTGLGLVIVFIGYLQTPDFKYQRQSYWVTHTKGRCNYNTRKVFSVFTSRWLVAASNGGRSLSSGFPNWPVPQLPVSHFSQLQISSDSTTTESESESESDSESYITAHGQSASLSWNKAPFWGLWPDFYYCQTVAGLLIWGALSDESTGLSFTIAVGPRHCSHSWVRVPRDSWQYFTVSDLRLPQPGGPGPRIYIPPGSVWPSCTLRHWVAFSSPLATRRATVEVFEPACPLYIAPARIAQKTSSITACSVVAVRKSCPQRCCLGCCTIGCLHSCYMLRSIIKVEIEKICGRTLHIFSQ
jgi:hypothetical protein